MHQGVKNTQSNKMNVNSPKKTRPFLKRRDANGFIEIASCPQWVELTIPGQKIDRPNIRGNNTCEV